MQEIKEATAVATQDSTVSNTQTVEVNGKQATLLVPDLNKDTELVIVPDSVLAFLITLLPKAKVQDIIGAFRDKLYNIQWGKAGVSCSMEAYTAALQEELQFHMSVNMVREHYTPKVEEVATQVVG